MDRFTAALPMYDWPEVRSEVDALWSALSDCLCAAGVDAPASLIRPGENGAPDDLDALWRDPRLLLAQTCWGPMRDGLADHVRVVGQPDYSACEGGAGVDYSSAILMRRGEAVEASAPADGSALLPDGVEYLRFAYNERGSMSGFKALTADMEAAGLALTASRVATGSHRNAIRAVAAGQADFCAIDCRSWALAQRWEPAATALVPVGWTARRLGLPFVMARSLAPLAGLVRSALVETGAAVPDC